MTVTARYPIERAEPEHCWWAESETEFRERTEAQVIAGLTVPVCGETT